MYNKDEHVMDLLSLIKGRIKTGITWVDGGGNLKPELKLATDMLCWKPPTQSVTDHSITIKKNKSKHLAISIST